jgi:hypothetical protein
MLHWTVFFLFVYIGYAVARSVFRKHTAPPAVPATLSYTLPEDLERDPAARVLLGLADDRETALLREQSAAGEAFARDLDARRGELIGAYAVGALSPRFRDCFKRAMLTVPGIAEEVEVERALNAVAEPESNNLRTLLTYKLRRVDALWRRLTLPRTDGQLQTAGGPCLMIRPAESETAPAELEGRVTAVSGDSVDINLGLDHGLGTGDFVQIERADTGWIATAVITLAEQTHSRALFSGDTQPAAGDRATAVLEGEVV